MVAAKVFCGADVGGISEKLGVRYADQLANPQHFVVIPTGDVDVRSFIERTIDGTEGLLASVGTALQDVLAFALLIPGQIDFRHRRIISVPNLHGAGWCGCAIGDDCSAALKSRTHIDIPVVLYHDARGAGMGEVRQGAAQGVDVVAGITTGTGIGGFVIWEDNGVMRVFDGAHQLGTEFGHMKIPKLHGRDDPPRCGCGQQGCWETYAGAKGIMHFAQLALARGTPTALRDSWNVTPEKDRVALIDRLAKEGDKCCRALIDDLAHYLGIGIANVINAFNPRVFLICGGMTNSGPGLLEQIKQYARRYVLPAYIEQGVELRYASLGSNAGWIGATYVAELRSCLAMHG